MPTTPLTTRVRALLCPELAAIPEDRRDAAFARARQAPLDFVEWVGVLAGVAATVALTRYSADNPSPLGRVAAALANFSQAVILLAVLVGPFLIRRTRRALRAWRDDEPT
jgi:hypothetical protein